VQRHIAARVVWSLLWSSLLLMPIPGRAASYYWARHPNHERVVFQFSAVPPLDVERISDTAIELRLPEGFWAREKKPVPFDLTPSRFVKAVRVEERRLMVELRRSDLEHLAFAVSQDNKIVLDLMRRPKPQAQANATGNGTGNASANQTNATQGANQTALEGQAAKVAPEANATTNASEVIPIPFVPPVPQDGDAAGSGPRLRGQVGAVPHPAAAPAPHRLRSVIDASASPERPGEVLLPVVPANETAQVSLPQELPPSFGRETPPLGPGPENATSSAQQVEVPVDGQANASVVAASPADANASGTPPGADLGSENATANATDQEKLLAWENLFETAQQALAQGDLAGALDALEGLRRQPDLPDPLREEVLYTLAELRMKEAKDDFVGHYLTVRQAFVEALNWNPTSPRAPQALINLGYLNLTLGNEPEAKGYFDLLRRKYPRDSHVPLIDYYWGEYYSRRGQWDRAADHFQAVIQQFPDSQPVLPSAVGLVRALAELGFWAKAWEIVDFVEKRWPRYYIDDLEFLALAGRVALNHELLNEAKEQLWMYYNLAGRNGTSSDMALARLGDIAVRQQDLPAAKTIYEKAAAEFPEREGGLIAMMRLAEEGIVDDPTLEGMAAVFDRPFTLRPERIYTDILSRFPDSALAPLARLKLAMWYLWTGRFAEAMDHGRQFQKDYGAHPLAPRAEETIFTALIRWMARDAEEENFRGLVSRFEANPDMASKILESDKLRLALALAYLKLGQPEKTLELARPFFFGPIAQGAFSIPALDLALAVLVDLGRWADVVELVGRVHTWNLGEERQRQVDYALALALENLGQQDNALELWKRLAIDVELPDSQRGHAVYFLARAAFAQGEWEQAYLAAQEAVALLLKKGTDHGKIRDALSMLVDITETTGRLEESLGWANQYEGYVEKKTPQWAQWTYRKAQIQRQLAREEEWRSSLQAIIDAVPDSLYARMARSDLVSADISQRVQQIQ